MDWYELSLALVLQDLALSNQFASPGHLSAGGKPCEYDCMDEEALRAIGKKKSTIGFKGTVRCYLERHRKLLMVMVILRMRVMI